MIVSQLIILDLKLPFLKLHSRHFLIFSVLISVGLNYLGVVWFSRFLRPSADDYCAGAVAQLGVFGAPLALWNTWAGFLFRNLIENILMGLPLLYLPWSFASSISFLISAIGLGLVVYFLLSFDAQDQFQKKLMFF